MIFDVHIHVQPWEMLKSEVRSMLEKTADPRVIDILAAPKNLLQWMDAEGIDRACLINYVSPDVMGFGRASIDWIAEFTAGHRDRLLPVGSVHPQVTPDVAAETNRILDLGIRLVKVHPPHQVIAANAYRHGLEKQAELYRICQERGVPVMFHTGTSIFPRARNVYADPMPIDDVAIDFPRLKIILAHAGRPLYGETAYFLARRHPNVLLEISGIPPRTLLEYVPKLSSIADKVLWGTDWPSPGVRSPRANVEAFRALGLGEEIERQILWENAAAIFGE